jgi:hypothetical protein
MVLVQGQLWAKIQDPIQKNKQKWDRSMAQSRGPPTKDEALSSNPVLKESKFPPAFLQHSNICLL